MQPRNIQNETFNSTWWRHAYRQGSAGWPTAVAINISRSRASSTLINETLPGRSARSWRRSWKREWTAVRLSSRLSSSANYPSYPRRLVVFNLSRGVRYATVDDDGVGRAALRGTDGILCATFPPHLFAHQLEIPQLPFGISSFSFRAVISSRAGVVLLLRVRDTRPSRESSFCRRNPRNPRMYVIGSWGVSVVETNADLHLVALVHRLRKETLRHSLV